jgi:Tol biopolymer transport system component
MERSADSAPSPGPTAGRLDSWKEIAAYLRRDVTTAQRWEKREGMPVHRHLHDKLGSVYAFSSELDAWAASRKLRVGSDEAPGAGDTSPKRAVPVAVSRRLVPAIALAIVLLAAGGTAAVWQLQAADYFWRNPLATARFQRITEFEGTEHSAVISRDGKLAAFTSSRDGQADVWVTQIGTGQFHNLTRGRLTALVNQSIRTMEFSPDAGLVSFWVGKSDEAKARQIGLWQVPTLSGEPQPYLDGVAEMTWSPDGQRFVYHTPAAGDPLFVKADGAAARLIFVAPPPQHSHFPTWSADGSFIYFVRGNVPDEMDIWRIRSTGGSPERITFHNSHVSHPTLVDQSTLLYLASAADGSGPSIYGLDLERRVPHRISSGVERYTSLAASADGRRLVATVARPRTSLWRVALAPQPAQMADARKIALPTAQGRLPRLAPDFLLYVASNGGTEGIWKFVDGTATQLWTGPAARIVGGPAIAPDGHRIAFSVEEGAATTRLLVMNVDGTGVRAVADSMGFRGAPAWSPDGQSIVIALNEGGRPRLFTISLATRSVARLVEEYSLDPAWAPSGEFLVYSGMDIGTTFPVKTVSSAGRPSTVPGMTLSRGARRFRFLPGQATLVILRGDVDHKELWAIDLKTGGERQLTNFGPDVRISDFDVSPDGREIVFERTQEDSDVVLIDRPKP